MTEPGVINTVVVRNGESFQVSIRRANGAPVTSSASASNAQIQQSVINGTSVQSETATSTSTSANAPVASTPVASTPATTAPSSSTPAFVIPMVDFMKHVQQNYNQPNMAEDAIDKELSELQIKDGRRFVNTNSTLRDNALQNKVETGRTTFSKYIKTIIANERGRVEESAENSVRQQRSQKNTTQTSFKERELAAKQEEYKAAFAAENEQQARYLAANKKLGDSEKEYPNTFLDLETRVKDANNLKEAKQREVEKLDRERKVLQVSNSNAPLSPANEEKIASAEKKYNDAVKELERLTKLQIQRSVIKDDFQSQFPTLEDYKAEQERLVGIENNKFDELQSVSKTISKEISKIQQELREIEVKNKQEEDTVKNQTIIASIKEIIGKVIPLITARLNVMNEVEKAIKAGLADYLVNRTIDETKRDNGTSEQDIKRSFTLISNNIRDKNDDLPNSIIKRMIDAAGKVHSSKSSSLAPYTFNQDDATAKAKITQEFYKMEPPTWEKSIFGLRGGRRTLRRKNVRRKTRRVTRPY